MNRCCVELIDAVARRIQYIVIYWEVIEIDVFAWSRFFIGDVFFFWGGGWERDFLYMCSILTKGSTCRNIPKPSKQVLKYNIPVFISIGQNYFTAFYVSKYIGKIYWESKIDVFAGS